jgi:hypothetical protein
MGFTAYFTDREGNVVGLWQPAGGMLRAAARAGEPARALDLRTEAASFEGAPGREVVGPDLSLILRSEPHRLLPLRQYLLSAEGGGADPE